MAETTRITRVRISLRSAFLLLGAIAAAALALRVLASSARVVGWILMAAAVAGLLHPLVVALDRRIPRGAAVAAVVIGVLGSIGLAGYALVDDIDRQTARLEEIAPRRAREIERSERFGEAAREFELAKRTRRFIKAIPERLRGGEPAEAIRAATTRGLAFLATGVLTIFFLLQGTRLARGALAQIPDPDRRVRATGIVRRVYHRSFGYARGTVALSVLNGLVAYGLARAADVPAPVALATWVALWNIVPVFGFVIGTAPIVILAAFRSPATALALALAFAAYEVVEGGVLRPRLERRTMRLGRFLTVLGAFGGLELYGLGGALLAVLALAGLVALADEVSAADTERVLA
jgi:predicted PurR-regulated permease PerM